MFSSAALSGLTLASFLALSAAPAPGQQPAWDRVAARHLLERATLGPTPAEIDRALAAGRDATIEALLSKGEPSRFRDVLATALHGGLIPPRALAERLDRRREGFVELCSDHVAPLLDFGNEWAARMLAGDDPLRDRMALFWHGHFVSSFRDVGDAWKMIAQIRFLRTHAFDRLETLLRGIARDPAMLQYLNNNKNVKAHPNENWARELMELFSLGDGNYTEQDIKEAARAYTGWFDEERRFLVRRVEHDFGQKTILGVTGDLDGDHVIDIILEQPACARFLARKLLWQFEGVEPSAERVETCAGWLRESKYDFRAFLARLFADPQFQREEVRGRRVLAPVEYCVEACRRVGLTPPGSLLFAAADLGGQRVFYPPSVKGWEGGIAWITAGTLLARSNACAMLMGLLSAEDLVRAEGQDAAQMELTNALLQPESNQARTGGLPMFQYAQSTGWKPALTISASFGPLGEKGAELRAAQRLTDSLWATPATKGELDGIVAGMRELRGQGLDDAAIWLRSAHYVLSLPRANLD